MVWRRARSLVVLEDEIQSAYPGTTVWDLGDQDHRERWSDHNPNSADVVCAIDVLSNAGLPLAWFVNTVVATDPPALKYVIYNRRIWHPGHGWSTYGGSNPHLSHAHVSVGVGPDGRSTGPYDDTTPWGVGQGESDMFCKYGDNGPAVKVLQYRLLNCGWREQLGAVDGDYGIRTAVALKAAMASLGTTDDGRNYGPEEMMRMDIIVARHYGGAGKPGPAGPAGPPGPAGKPGPPGDVTATVAAVVADMGRRMLA